MEEDLDAIARGDEAAGAWLRPLLLRRRGRVAARACATSSPTSARSTPAAISTIPIGDDIVVRVGPLRPLRRGDRAGRRRPATGEVTDAAAWVTTRRQSRRATINDDIAPDEMTPAKARELLEAAADDGRVLGQDPGTGRDIVAKAGRYGPYVTEVLPEEVDEAPAKGKAKVQGRARRRCSRTWTSPPSTSTPRCSCFAAAGGRPGPRVRRGDHRAERPLRSLPEEGHRLALARDRGAAVHITLEEALAIYAQPKQRGRAAAEPPLRPSSATTRCRASRWWSRRAGSAPYVTDGETNATLRKDDEPESITPERGAELLAEKRARGPVTRKRATQEDGQEGDHQEGRGEEDHGQEGHGQEDRLTLPAPRRTARVPARGARRTTSRARPGGAAGA